MDSLGIHQRSLFLKSFRSDSLSLQKRWKGFQISLSSSEVQHSLCNSQKIILWLTSVKRNVYMILSESVLNILHEPNATSGYGYFLFIFNKKVVVKQKIATLVFQLKLCDWFITKYNPSESRRVMQLFLRVCPVWICFRLIKVMV